MVRYWRVLSGMLRVWGWGTMESVGSPGRGHCRAWLLSMSPAVCSKRLRGGSGGQGWEGTSQTPSQGLES